MPTHSGLLSKMHTLLPPPRAGHPADPVEYTLMLGDEGVALNPLFGSRLLLEFTGTIRCSACGRITKKSFGQGFCYPCFRDAPEASPCIIRPELCEAHTGGGRDPAWEAAHHLAPHVVYLAVTSALKVGVTRADQVPTRWIDQGAWRAIRLAVTETRRQAGLIEVALKEHVSDRTAWQKMLKNILAEEIDLVAEKQRLAALLPSALASRVAPSDDITEITYPVLQHPTKIKSQTFDKVPRI